MKTKPLRFIFCLALSCAGLDAALVGSAFHYNGLLQDAGTPANGSFDLQFRLFDTLAAGSPIGTPVTLDDVAVNNGIFTVTLDFGAAVFDGNARFLEVGVRPATSTGIFNTLSPRQPVRPTPEAIHAAKADTANSVPDGTVVRSISGLRDNVTLAAGAGISITPIGSSLRISASGSPAPSQLSASDGSPATAVQVDSNGNVGIGTSTPTSKLDVRGNLSLEAGGSPSIYTGTGLLELNRYFKLLNSPNFDSASGLKAGGVLVSDSYAYANPGKNDLVVKGNVGIGTPAPTSPLDIVGTTTVRGSTGGLIRLLTQSGVETITIDAQETASNGSEIKMRNAANALTVQIDADALGNGSGYLALYKSDGTVGMILAADSGGNATITTQVLQITGGSDLSERFDIAAPGSALEPGMVVCIDPENPGKLVCSSKAFDRTVAGIISGANGVETGMVMGQAGSVADGKYPVALTGRVYVHADASKAPIQLGDLLTTSDTPGHCQVVTDHAKATGAIIGKAMTALPAGKGLVLVLVSLQ